jgi:hypothetical protein
MNNATSNLKMKFLTEEPSKVDSFRGESHSHVATQIIDTFENQKHVNNICLEGDLGAGKSTVIGLAQKDLEGKGYVFTTFDVEKYQHSATKKALVTALAASISSLPQQNNIEQIERAKNIALGKQFDYEKITDSKINPSTLIFAFLLLASTQVIKPSIESISNTILALTTNGNVTFDLKGFLYILVLFLPVTFLLGVKVLKKPLFVKVWPKLSNLKGISFGNLLKRNSKDVISEKLLVNKEVGSIELQEAFESFSSFIPTGVNFVLVLDNIDRITDDDKIREVWSDIELFISCKVPNFKLIIPFSIKQVASAISNDETTGMESVTKQCPVRLWVAPVVSAGWREVFVSLFNQSFEEHDFSNENIDTCADILEIWCNHFKLQITPRLLKQYLNGIISTIKCCPVDVHPIIASLYYLSIRYFYFDFASLVKQIDNSSNYEEGEKIVIESQRLLRRDFTDEVWSKLLVCIHFQTQEDIALSEWLIEPLKAAFKFVDVEEILTKQHVFGFSNICKKLISTSDIEDVLLVSAEMLEHSDDSKEWLNNWFKEINRVFNETYHIKDAVGKDVLNALDRLKENSFIINNKTMSKKFTALNAEITNLSKQNTDEVKEEDLKLMYRLGCLLERKPRVLTNVKSNGKAFVELFWSKAKEFSYWNIKKVKWTQETSKAILANLFDENDEVIESTLLHELCLNIKLGWIDFHTEDSPTHSLNLFNAGNINANLDQDMFDSFTFDKTWYSSNLSAHYLTQFPNIQHIERDDYLAQVLAHIIQHKAWNEFQQYKGHFDSSEDLSKYLKYHLPFVNNFQLLFDALNQQLIRPLVEDSIKSLVTEGKIHTQNINMTLSENYENVRSMFDTRAEFFNWSSGWSKYIKWDRVDLFSEIFIADALTEDSFSHHGINIIATLDNEKFDSTMCNDVILNPTVNQRLIVKHLNINNKKLAKCNLNMADSMIKLIESSSSKLSAVDSNWIKSIVGILNSNTKGKVLRRAASQILLNNVELESKYVLLSKFLNLINIREPQNSSDESNIISIYESVDSSNDELLSLLDNQSLNLDNWSAGNRTAFIEMLELNKDNYSSLSSIYVK